MKKTLVALVVPLCLLVLFTGSAAAGEESHRHRSLLSPDELEDLLAPIALYPDPLLAQLLPASTFTDQISQAARFLERYGSSADIDRQDWDVSVKAVAHYPELLFMMDRDFPWTVTVGQAFLNQEPEVLDAIQRLRWKAYQVGNLRSTREQQVLVAGQVIRIVPADPAYLYLPQYDPQVVYLEPPASGYTLVTFGLGFTIGSWLNRDCDWSGRRIYYHGWRDRGWVKRSRPFVQTRNRAYVGRSAREIRVDRSVSRRDNRAFVNELRSGSSREGRAPASVPRARRGPQLRPPAGGSTPAGRQTPRPAESAPAEQIRPQPAAPPAATQSPAAAPSAPAAPHAAPPATRAR